ncbi:c-myc binding [Stylonychia lemnae]|uniref:C-myc binding n=1 Tax=Stylonychia lemnae TaxID=5949 RepID=A0A078A5G2_STYLE|nr:c-myc binding [Stylonychia lemnae]|eukprot:CDW75994.1 c-myc binding [Stylonychia lemnae]
MSVQTTEQKKEEFRKYLEKAGVVDQLTKVLVGLYEEPEKPSNAIEFIKKCLGAPSDTDVEQLKADNEELRRQQHEMEKKIEALQRELEHERAKQ